MPHAQAATSKTGVVSTSWSGLLTTAIVAELFAVMLTLAEIAHMDELWATMFYNSAAVQLVVLVTLLFWQIIARLKPRSTLSFYLICAYLTALVSTAGISQVLFESQYFFALPIGFESERATVFVIRNMGITAIAGAMAVHYLWVQNEWRRGWELHMASREEALKARIRPHFLFNALNTIAHLTRSNPEAAEESVEDLADLFRASLGRHGKTISLSEEIHTCQRYQRMEQFRLGERLRVHWDIDDLPMRARIPALVLQPLLENAIYHGVETATNGGCINIVGHVSDDHFTVEMTNPAPVQRSGAKKHDGNQIALDNIRQRLALTYGGKATMAIEHLGDCYQVTLKFPLNQSDEVSK